MNRLSAPLWAYVECCIVRDTTFIRKEKSKIEEKITNLLRVERVNRLASEKDHLWYIGSLWRKQFCIRHNQWVGAASVPKKSTETFGAIRNTALSPLECPRVP